MEYDFRQDVVTKAYRADFNDEQQLFSPWLEQEIGDNANKLAQVLTAIDKVLYQPNSKQCIIGKAYSLLLEQGDAIVVNNQALADNQPQDNELELLLAQDLSLFEGSEQSACGIEDLAEMLKAWALFIR